MTRFKIKVLSMKRRNPLIWVGDTWIGYAERLPVNGEFDLFFTESKGADPENFLPLGKVSRISYRREGCLVATNLGRFAVEMISAAT